MKKRVAIIHIDLLGNRLFKKKKSFQLHNFKTFHWTLYKYSTKHIPTLREPFKHKK